MNRTIYKLEVLVSINEYLEIKNGISKNQFHIKHSYDREYDLMGIGKVSINFSYINNSEVEISLKAGLGTNEYIFSNVKRISDIIGIYRLDFIYKDEKKTILLNFNKDFGTRYYTTINEFNVSQLNIFNWKAKKLYNDDISNYIEYYDFSNIRNLILCGYLTYKFFLREDVSNVYITELRNQFIDKLDKVGMIIEDFEDVEDDIIHEVERVQKNQVLEPYNLAFLIIALIESYSNFACKSLDYIDENILYDMISSTLNKYDDISNL